MMKTKSDQDPRILEDMFYAKRFAFSYSSLNKLLYSPGLFYRHYILGDRDDELDKSLVDGRIIHNLLLDQDTFSDTFVIAQTKLPSDNVKDVIGKVYAKYLLEKKTMVEEARSTLTQYSEEILEELKEKNLYQKMSDEIKLGKIINEEGIEYFNFLKEATGKTVIDAATYSRCVEIVDKIKQHECMKRMGLHPSNNRLEDVYQELEFLFNMDDDSFPFDLKGIVDNIFVDRDTQKVWMNDLKTTSKTIAEFPDTVQFYNYWMQAAIYMRAMRYLMANRHPGYDIVFSFIVVDKYGQIYVFEVSDDTMTNWEIDLQDKLKEAKYHYESRDYSLPYRFLKSKVIL
jgi:hypothetical protein